MVFPDPRYAPCESEHRQHHHQGIHLYPPLRESSRVPVNVQVRGQSRASCHGAGKIAPHPEFPARGRLAVEGLRETRALLKDVRNAISRVKDPARRTSLESAAQQAEVPIIEATQAGHAFVFDQLEERAATARARLTALFERVSNPDRR